MSELYERPIRLVQNRIGRNYLGGRETDRFRGLPQEQCVDDDRPESWVGSTTRVNRLELGEDPNKGMAYAALPGGGQMLLKELIDQAPEQFLGAAHVRRCGADTGVLVKLLDAQHQLGLQCHPDRKDAMKYWNSPYGKEESWYIIGKRTDADEPPYVLLGFKEGASIEEYSKYYFAGDVPSMEKMCHKIPVEVGQMFHVAAGCPHAIGGGCFVIEVQEPSDITLGARRKHFDDPAQEAAFDERTMRCYHYEGASYEENLAKYLVEPEVLQQTPQGRELKLIGRPYTNYFSATRLEVTGHLQPTQTGAFTIAIVLSGSGKLETRAESVQVKQGDEIFLPAGAKDVALQADGDGLCVICSHPPEIF